MDFPPSTRAMPGYQFRDQLFAALERSNMQLSQESLQLVCSGGLEPLLTRIPQNEGKTILHLAVERTDTEVIALVLGNLQPDDVCTLLRSRCNRDETALHLAAKNADVQVMRSLLSFVRRADRPKLLAVRSVDGLTPLHVLKHVDMYQDILSDIENESRVKVLSEENDANQSVFLNIVLRGCSRTVETIMQLVPAEHRLQLLEDQVEVVLMFAVENNNHDLIRNLMRSLGDAGILEFMKWRYRGGVTALHFVLENHEMFEIIMEMIPENGRKSILRLRYDDSATVLLSAVNFNRASVIRCILNKVPSHDKKELLELKYGDMDWTCLHGAAKTGTATTIISLLEPFSEKEKLELLSHPAKDGKCPFFLLGLSEENGLERIIIDHVFLSKRVSMKEFCRKMTEVSNRYMLHSAPTVLILYNTFADYPPTKRREDAREEMESISNVLIDIGAKVEIKSDFTDLELLSMIRNAKEKEDISALIVIAMSHGDRGVILDKRMTTLEIQEIITEMSAPARELLPKVLILQACQGLHEPILTAPSTSPPAPAPIPHNGFDVSVGNDLKATFESRTRDFLILSPTLPGEMARRNFFIPKLAQCIRDCHHLNNLCEMYQLANADMSQALGIDQIPGCNTTMRKSFHFVWHPREVA